MSVALDLSALDPEFKEHAHRGIGRYVRELKSYFENDCKNPELVSFFDHRSITGKVGSALSNSCDYLPAFRQTVKQQLILPACYAARSRRDQQVFHFPAHMDAPANFMPAYILTVLDLIPQVLPDLYKADKINWRFRLARYLENKAIKNASMILCISHCTAKDVREILGIPAEKIRVTPLGVDRKFFEAAEADKKDFSLQLGLETDRQKLLYVGGIDPRKNWILALNVMRELKSQNQKNCPYILFAGNIKSDRQYPKLLKMIEELELQDLVRLTGYLPDDKLLNAYSCCDAFFFPSLYEGFGLPPLEAMAAGLPVLSSDTSSMPEVLGQAAIMFNPLRVEQAVAAVNEILANKSLKENLREKGRQQAKKFTWINTGLQTENAYLEYLSGRDHKSGNILK